MELTDMLIVISSRLGVGEEFSIKIKLCGEVREVPCAGGWNTKKPGTRGPFNLNVQRGIQFKDNCLPEWTGKLLVSADGIDGPDEIAFNGQDQGAYPGDRRPIKTAPGFRWTTPGFHFVRLTDPESGAEGWSNPVYVSDAPPAERLYWGDPHWQTIFSDGIRCPEELYAFARDEAFLDFGAMADHMEGVTNRQWEYFQAVTNDYNEPSRFVTLQGQEWTNHNPKVGAPGHRNVYYRGDGGPVLRSDDPECNTLEKLWRQLDSFTDIDAIAIPHHSANVVMGVDWEQGWNPKYEKAVEVYSVWGSSEKSAEDGNFRPIGALKGEMKGRHVLDALKKGYRFGFVGGGDIHDGRPGDDLHNDSYPPRDHEIQPQGFTAAFAPELTRECIFDAMKTRQTYATTRSRTYLDVRVVGEGSSREVELKAASHEGIQRTVMVRSGIETEVPPSGEDHRVLETELTVADLAPDEFCYFRIETTKGNMAWSSPFWGDGG